MTTEKAGNLFASLTIIGVVTACAAPAITLNVWPRLETMWESGWTSNELGIVLLVGISAIAMTTIPFAMQKAPNRAFWWTALAFGVGLAVLNYIMAVGAIGKLSDGATEKAAAAISKAANLKDQLEELRAARRELGAFKPATAEMLKAANEAVRLASEARDRECERVGDHCRARVAQVQSRLSERADITAAAALTRRAIELDGRRDELERQVGSLGSIPRYTNPQAERIKSIVQFVYPKAATEAVASGIIHFLAIAAELFALGMPRIIVTALSRPIVRTENAGRGRPQLLGALSPRPIANRRGHQQKLSPPANGRVTAHTIVTVAAWKAEAIRPGKSKAVCWDVYQRYVKWCKEQGASPATFTQFDFELCEAGVQKTTEGRGSYYIGVQL